MRRISNAYLDFGIIFLSLLCFSLPAFAQQKFGNSELYQVNSVLGDGSNGRPFQKWTQGVQNQPVQKVTLRVQKTAGGPDAYLNLRFDGGQTFENGRRFALTGGDQTITVHVGGQSPNGKPLVLNVYKGSALLKTATVTYNTSVSRGSTIRGVDRNPGRRNTYPGGSIKRPPAAPPKVIDRDPRWGNPNTVNENIAFERCRNTRIRRPKIDVGEVRPSGGLFSGKYRIQGSVRGTCIEEAAYFEGGRLRKEIPVPLSDRFQRQEFSFQARSGRNGKIRVTTTDGREEEVLVDELVQDSGR